MTSADPTFDIGAYADDIEEMRRVQDDLDAEARPRAENLAEALFLLAVCDDIRTQRFAALQRAEVRLGRSLDVLCAARTALDAATDLEIEAMTAVSLLRGESRGAVERVLSTTMVSL